MPDDLLLQAKNRQFPLTPAPYKVDQRNKSDDDANKIKPPFRADKKENDLVHACLFIFSFSRLQGS